jgi:hypothetical protein
MSAQILISGLLAVLAADLQNRLCSRQFKEAVILRVQRQVI